MISFCGLDASSDHHKTAFVQLCRDILEVERNGMHEKASVLLLQHILPVYAAGATVAKRSNVILSHGLGIQVRVEDGLGVVSAGLENQCILHLFHSKHLGSQISSLPQPPRDAIINDPQAPMHKPRQTISQHRRSPHPPRHGRQQPHSR